MLKRISTYGDRHTLAVSVTIVLAYLAFFVFPAAFSAQSFGRGGTHTGVDSMTADLSVEVLLAGSVLAIIFLLGWQRKVGLLALPKRGTLRWLIAPIMLIIIMFLAAMILGVEAPEGTFPGTSTIIALFITVGLVGLFEELLFRGVLLHGLRTSFGPIVAVFGSALAFGLMHYVNWVDGQPLAGTTIQVAHAAAAGILYAALALMTNSIWPSILLHALWDGVVSIISTVSEATAPAIDVQTSAAQAATALAADPAASDIWGNITIFLLFGFEPTYGVIVILAWLAMRRKNA